MGAAADFALVVARNWESLRSRWREAGRALGLGLALASRSLIFAGVAALALAVCALSALAGRAPAAISPAAPPPRRTAR